METSLEVGCAREARAVGGRAAAARAAAAAAPLLDRAVAARRAGQGLAGAARAPPCWSAATQTRSRMMLSSAQLYMKIGAPGGMLEKRLLMISAPGYWVRPMP